MFFYLMTVAEKSTSVLNLEAIILEEIRKK